MGFIKFALFAIIAWVMVFFAVLWGIAIGISFILGPFFEAGKRRFWNG